MVLCGLNLKILGRNEKAHVQKVCGQVQKNFVLVQKNSSRVQKIFFRVQKNCRHVHRSRGRTAAKFHFLESSQPHSIAIKLISYNIFVHIFL
jgi:hypothetical protein